MTRKAWRRILSALLALVMVAGMIPASALAADNTHAGHRSCVYHVEAAEGNCTTPGNIEFWYCDYYTCKKCYSDEAMSVEISPAETIITPGVHSDACVNCGYTTITETFDLFVPSEQPDYDEDFYFHSNGGFHKSFSNRLQGFKILFVGEGSDGKLYAMGNETNADGSRQAIKLSPYLNADGSVTVDSDAVEFFTYKVYTNLDTYTFSPDNGYMAVVDGKIVVRGQNIEDFRVGDINDPNDDLYDAFPQAIRFEQDNSMDDYDAANGKGYLFSWSLDSGMITFDPAEPAFVPTTWSSGGYTHSIMLYIERCEHENLIHTEGAELSCTQDGAIENWYCKDCQLYFADADASEYIELPENEDNYEDYLYTQAWGHSYGENCICENCGETCPHTDAVYEELEDIEASCFEPGMSGYWFCEECYRYLDKNKENGYWEPLPASKKPATGHYFNTDTGVCDECGMSNPVYTRVTSLDAINEEDLYIIVAEVEGEESTKYFVLGGLDERHPDEQGNIRCVAGNAIRVTANSDGSISLVNQEVLEDGSPSEFMFDVYPEQLSGDMSDLGLTTLMLKLPNHCVYPFQSYGYEDTGYMGVSRYATEYGQWDASDWVIDFYTTVETDDTYRYEDEFGSKTHAQQVADGNIGNNIAEGDLLLYRTSFYAVGGAMFTLRLREYNDQYYFICGEDWALEGSDGWDYVTNTTPTNDVQYAISLYRYDVPTVDTHTCEFTNWTDNNDNTHTGTCECGETKTESHGWNNGEETQAPKCTEEGVKTYTCTKCTATKEEAIDALDHDWSTWTDDGANAATDTHARSCQREGCNAKDTDDHEWSGWTSTGSEEHKKTCSVCSGTRTDTHKWNDGEVTTEPTEDAEGVKTYTCTVCSHSKTESVDKLPHDHIWSDWSQNDENTHIQYCHCNEVQTEEHHFDDGVVINWATHLAPGEIWFTCADCGYIRSVEQPILEEHEWGKWNYNNNGTHTRSCICNETETKDCTWDAGVVTKQPTHYEEGIKTYTCSVCSGIKTEAIAKTPEHQWSDWTGNDDGRTHSRECICKESETFPHNWSMWNEQDAGEYRRTCADCGASETMTLNDEKPVNTTNNTFANTTLTNSDFELIDKVLTSEEQSQVAEGAEVKVYLKVEDISNETPTEHKAEVEAKAGDNEIGMYLDIDLFKQIGTATEIPVTETTGAVSITITIPEDLINTDISVTRTYTIIRVHEDENGNLITDVIEGKFNPEDNTFTFETDKFSTYALAYHDTDGIPGDLDHTGAVDEDDVIYLLQHLLMPEDFKVDQPVDYDKNSVIDEDDVIYLLQHLLMPGDFPL